MTQKNETQSRNSVLTLSGLNGKTITGVDAYRHGSVTAIEISFSGGSAFLKVRPGGELEIGGTLDLGSGTTVPLPTPVV